MCHTVISPETMDGLPQNGRFRALFDPDPECANKQFALLMLKLQRYFAWRCRGDAEELASETVSRAIKRISEGAPVSDIANFCYGIAANIKREDWKKRREEEITTDPVAPEPPLFGLHSNEQAVLVEQCLRKVPPEARTLLREYFWGDRVQLAADQGLSKNALRIRVFRALEEIRALVVERTAGAGA